MPLTNIEAVQQLKDARSFAIAMQYPAAYMRSVVAKLQLQAYLAGLQQDGPRYTDLNTALWHVMHAMARVGNNGS